MRDNNFITNISFNSSVLAPKKYFEDVTRSTPSRQTSNRTSNFQRPVIVKELRSTIEWLEADSKNELSMEYESINLVSDKTATCNVAKLPENKERNRYTNILSCMMTSAVLWISQYNYLNLHILDDHSRVKLTTVPPSADYINASFISVGKQCEFIVKKMLYNSVHRAMLDIEPTLPHKDLSHRRSKIFG